MITKNLNQALFAAMFGEDEEVIVENVGENLDTLPRVTPITCVSILNLQACFHIIS